MACPQVFGYLITVGHEINRRTVWRLVFGFGMVPALICLLMALRTKDNARFTQAQARWPMPTASSGLEKRIFEERAQRATRKCEARAFRGESASERREMRVRKRSILLH
jgi:hypothetical protein